MTIEEIRKVFIDYGDVSQEHIKILFAEIDRLTQVLKLEEQRNAARLGVNDRLIRKNTELEAEIDYLRKRLNRAVDIAESLNLDEPDKHTYIDMVAELQQIGKEVQQ